MPSVKVFVFLGACLAASGAMLGQALSPKSSPPAVQGAPLPQQPSVNCTPVLIESKNHLPGLLQRGEGYWLGQRNNYPPGSVIVPRAARPRGRVTSP